MPYGFDQDDEVQFRKGTEDAFRAIRSQPALRNNLIRRAGYCPPPAGGNAPLQNTAPYWKKRDLRDQHIAPLPR